MKNTTINLRVDKITKSQLEILSERKNVNISNIIRNAVSQLLENKIYFEPELARTKDGLHIVKTIGFTEFVFWLYHKTIDPEISEINELYIQFIKIIKECKKYPIFNSELTTEFDKVSTELKKIVYDKTYNPIYFQFSDLGANSFDYAVLADFMHTIRYDQDSNKIIHCK